jgi:hypothetical protein
MSELFIRKHHSSAIASSSRDRARPDRKPAKSRPPHRRRIALWVGLGVLLGLAGAVVGGAIVGNRVYAQALDAKSSLEQVMPLASTVRDQILSGDSDAASATLAQLAALTADARAQTDDRMWKGLEWLPVIGDDLHAIRVASEVTDDLATTSTLSGLSTDPWTSPRSPACSRWCPMRPTRSTPRHPIWRRSTGRISFRRSTARSPS